MSPEQKTYSRLLAAFLEEDLMPNMSCLDRGYSSCKEANALIFSAPQAFVIGLIFDQSIQSSLAWEAPLHLKDRLGHLDISTIARMSEEDLKAAIAKKKSLHRYPGVISRYIIKSASKISEIHSGDARKLWDERKSVEEVKNHFLHLDGIGEKKANLAILMLVRDFGLSLTGLELLPLAMDVHLDRVLRRSDLFGQEPKLLGMQARECFGRIHNFPALLGTALWFIGRNFCHERGPDCNACPLAKGCLKKGIA